MGDRLRQARKSAGYDSAQAAADAFGWPIAAYRHHENGTRSFDVATAARYGRALKANPGWLLGLDKVQSEPIARLPAEATVEVVGTVAAGLWRESYEFEDDERFKIVVGPNPFPGARRFGLRVTGDSMDLEFPDGTVLDCVSIFDLNLAPETGDHVIVERTRSDGLREWTVKEFHVDDEGRRWLMPRSSRPEFGAPIDFGLPHESVDAETTVQVIAFVIGDYRSRVSRFMTPARVVRRRRR